MLRTGSDDPRPPVQIDEQRKVAYVSDRSGTLRMRVSYGDGCTVDQLSVGAETIPLGKRGGWSGILAGDEWIDSGIASAKATIDRGSLIISGIKFSDVEETWTFTSRADRIDWQIRRTYSHPASVRDLALPAITFADMSTWTGAILNTGGVAWPKLFDAPRATYAVHGESALLWNKLSGNCLELKQSVMDNHRGGLRFTRERDGEFTVAFQSTISNLEPQHGLARFLRDRQDVWRPINVPRSIVSLILTLKARRYDEAFDRGKLKGIDGAAVREIMNTIGRIGVIDEKIIGTNGWYSGYAVLHEPWISLIGLAVDDPNYTRNMAATLDYQRQHAVASDGMVKSRWAYGPYDAQPGTYDSLGFYECQWGRLMDTQPSFVINVAEQFDLSGDRAWLARQKKTCESALEYLLRRDSNGNGLVEVANDTRADRRASDWLDTIWASYETAFVNAQMYRALVLWADVEEELGDKARADDYRRRAEKLRNAFNDTFWDDKNGWYAYWREKDGKLYGNNLTIPVNFMAIGYGLCRNKARIAKVLDKIEEEMTRQNLFCWPSVIYAFTPDETNDQPFPTYENGDIFMAWAELGIRCYAKHNPAVALKYVKNVLARYDKDGLAFQRYRRKDQSGAGDDILANNCSAVVGLYRNIYGIQPKHDRLFLDPHLTPELNGTVAKLRGVSFSLSVGDYKVTSGERSVRAHSPFGVAFRKDGLDCFEAESGPAWLSVKGSRGPLDLQLRSRRSWSVKCEKGGKLTLAVRSSPGSACGFEVDGKLHNRVAQSDGIARLELVTRPGFTHQLALRPHVRH